MAKPPSTSSRPGRGAEGKDDGRRNRLARWLLDHQITICFGFLASSLLAHVVAPSARPYTSKLFFLSYRNPSTGQYAAGRNDLGFIFFCIVLFSGLRAASLSHVLAPLARALGLSGKKEVTRFAEQAWMLAFYSAFWPLGMYIYTQSPFFLNLRELWTDWPQRELPALTKAYMLAEWAFWLQQVVTLHIEERRKDHWQMLTHHFLTIALIHASYVYHFTRVGTLILILMDVIDIILPLAKCTKYVGFTNLCDYLFGLFAAVWLVTRHVFYLMVCWSAYSHTRSIIPSACYKGPADNLDGPFPIPQQGWSHLIAPFRESNGTVCFDDTVRMSFVSYLMFLQVLMVLWSFFIVQVIVRVMQGKGADDVRSDGEDEEEEEEEDEAMENEGLEYIEAQPLEEEVGVDGLDFEGWKRRTHATRVAGSSGVSVPGHSDRKELLNRIGCDKKID